MDGSKDLLNRGLKVRPCAKDIDGVLFAFFIVSMVKVVLKNGLEPFVSTLLELHGREQHL